MRISLLADINSAHTMKWVNALLDHNYSVQCISINPAKSPTQHPNLEIIDLGIDAEVSRENSSLRKWSYLLKIGHVKRSLRSFQPDYIHAHFASSYGLLGLFTAEPYYVSLWGSDILTFPNKNFLFKSLLGIILKRAVKVFATSHFMAEKCKALYNLEPIVIPFGINVSEFSRLDESKKSPANSITIGTIKSIEKIYGIDLLIKAFALAVKETKLDLRLKIIGDGSLMDEYQELVKSLQIDNLVTFTGRISHNKVSEALHSFHIFANLSRQESFGVSVLEASAAGLPVIVSDINGLKEVYIESQTGVSVNILDLNDVKQKLLDLASNEDERVKLGKNGQRFVNENFDWNSCVVKQLSHYQD